VASISVVKGDFKKKKRDSKGDCRDIRRERTRVKDFMSTGLSKRDDGRKKRR
jgi:hypothetical protein